MVQAVATPEVLRGQQQVTLGEQLRSRQQTERFADEFLVGLIKFRGRSVRGTKFNGEINRACGRCSQVSNLSSQVGLLLQTGSLQSGAVEKIFGSHSAFSKRAIRDKLAEIYSTFRNQFDGSTANGNTSRGDWIFFSLLGSICPQPITKHTQDAAIILLSYFFETCDIYEDPNLI